MEKHKPLPWLLDTATLEKVASSLKCNYHVTQHFLFWTLQIPTRNKSRVLSDNLAGKRNGRTTAAHPGDPVSYPTIHMVAHNCP